MRKNIILLTTLLLIYFPTFMWAGTSDTVRTEIESTDEIPLYRPSLGGATGAANPNAYFRATVNNVFNLYDPFYLKYTDVDDSPVHTATTVPISSNWSYLHAVAGNPHPNLDPLYIILDNSTWSLNLFGVDPNVQAIANAFDSFSLASSSLEVNLIDPADDTWQGNIESSAIYGGDTTGFQWAVLYAKDEDDGNGKRYYPYDANGVDAATYGPCALIVSSGSPVAGDTITITAGPGYVANEGWSSTAAKVGKGIYGNVTPGYITSTIPSASGTHIVQIGVNVSSPSRGIWYVSFTYPDVLIP